MQVSPLSSFFFLFLDGGLFRTSPMYLLFWKKASRKPWQRWYQCNFKPPIKPERWLPATTTLQCLPYIILWLLGLLKPSDPKLNVFMSLGEPVSGLMPFSQSKAQNQYRDLSKHFAFGASRTHLVFSTCCRNYVWDTMYYCRKFRSHHRSTI